MKLVVSVRHDEAGSTVGGVAFEDWADAEPARTVVTRLPPMPRPPRGEPDTRDAQAVAALLGEHRLSPDLILLDDLVHLDVAGTPGPGEWLHRALAGRVPVVGVATSGVKTPVPHWEVPREEEAPPVLVTAAGLDLGAAKARVRAMHGRKRMPTLVKLAARLAKGGA